MTTALLIIDVQQALCSGEEAAFDIDRVIDKINGVGAMARSAGAPVILIQHEEDSGEMQFDSEGWQLAEGLATAPADFRIRKTTPDSFHGTELHQLLQERGIGSLIICGLQSDFCVNATVRRAMTLGYNVVLVANGHSTLDSGGESAAQIIARHNTLFADMASAEARIAVTRASEVQIDR